MERLRRNWIPAAFAAGGVLCALLTANAANPPDMTRVETLSTEVVASDGTLLRAFLSKDGYWRMRTGPDDVPPRYLAVLKAYEDQRYDTHIGVDAAALARAAAQFAGAGHIVSGGSTLTMQVARLLEPYPRGVVAKLFQMVRALQLEMRYSKREILSFYLTLAPMGGNLEGVRAAALSYFGKDARSLSLAEAALLVALPQSPVKQRPDRHAIAATKGRNKVLTRMVSEHVVTPGDARVAMREGVPFARQPMPMSAAHLSERLARAQPGARIVTTIDSDLQGAIERLSKQESAYFDDGASLALVVVENKSRKVLAYLGGNDYWGPSGQVDLARRARSPGSTLKPFIYGLAFDDLALHPSSMIQDQPTQFGDYAPKDFDGRFQGSVTARDALQMSLNVPAVMVLERVGPLRFTQALTNAGATLAFPDASAAPTLPVALGGLGISLADLTMLYAGIAEAGMTQPLRYLASDEAKPPQQLFGPLAAYYLKQILYDVALPDGWAMGQGLARKRKIGFKTGTSYGYRDAWAAGFSNDYAIGAWVGRADGAPRPGHMGREMAAPLLLKIFQLLPADRRPDQTVPAGALLVQSTDQLPPSLRIFTRESEDAAQREMIVPPPAISFPPNGATVPLPNGKDADKTIALKADGGRAPLTWLVDGAPLGSFDRFQPVYFAPEGEGVSSITVVDAQGRSDTSKVRFKRMN